MSASRTTHWTWPMIAAALPTRAGMRFLAARAAASDTATDDAPAAWREASALGFTSLPETGGGPAPAVEWMRAWRLTRLVDHADLFLNLTRSTHWLRKHVEVQGEWPRRGPLLAVTSHWGAGLWSLTHLARSGVRARFLSRRLEFAPAADPALVRYARLRVRAMRRATGASLIYTGGARAAIAAAWSAGESVVALFDVPPERDRATISLPFGPARVRVPLGLLRLAVEHAVPVVPFAVGVDRASGARRLTIEPARVFDSPEALGTALATHLHGLLTADSAAWHLWPHAAALLTAEVAAPPD